MQRLRYSNYAIHGAVLLMLATVLFGCRKEQRYPGFTRVGGDGKISYFVDASTIRRAGALQFSFVELIENSADEYDVGEAMVDCDSLEPDAGMVVAGEAGHYDRQKHFISNTPQHTQSIAFIAHFVCSQNVPAAAAAAVNADYAAMAKIDEAQAAHAKSLNPQIPQGSLKSTRDLEKYVGTFPCANGLLEEKVFLASLKHVLGSDYTAYREFMGFSGCGAIEKKGDFLLMDVTEHHVGPGYCSLILVRLSDGQMFLLWINKAREADKQSQFYGPRPVPDEVGKIVENSLNEGLFGFAYDVKVTVHGEDFDITERH